MNQHNDRSLLLGIPVDNVNMNDALGRIMTMVNQYETDRKNRLVATANVDFLVNAHDRKDKERANELLSVLRSAELVTADGMPLVWLSQMLGKPLKERVTGADMVPALAERAALEGKSIYLFGGIDGSAKNTAKILQKRYPGLKIAGYSAPYIDLNDKIENKVEIARINITQPDILLIALGNPKQEIWFQRFKKYLKVPVSIGIGGTFEFISGATNRAPEWMQRTGLEWIYRMSQDPRRLVNRYVKGLYRFNRMALPLLALNSLAQRIRRSSKTERALVHQGTTDSAIQVNSVDIPGLEIRLETDARQRMAIMDFSRIPALDPEDMSNLADLLLQSTRMGYVPVFTGLRRLPSMLLRVYRIHDLVDQAVNQVDLPEVAMA